MGFLLKGVIAGLAVVGLIVLFNDCLDLLIRRLERGQRAKKEVLDERHRVLKDATEGFLPDGGNETGEDGGNASE